MNVENILETINTNCKFASVKKRYSVIRDISYLELRLTMLAEKTHLRQKQ